MKAAWVDLGPDPNYPGLRVHRECADELDPYLLPPPADDVVSLAWARPDAPLATDPNGIITEDGNYFIITEDGNYYVAVG